MLGLFPQLLNINFPENAISMRKHTWEILSTIIVALNLYSCLVCHYLIRKTNCPKLIIADIVVTIIYLAVLQLTPTPLAEKSIKYNHKIVVLIYFTLLLLNVGIALYFTTRPEYLGR